MQIRSLVLFPGLLLVACAAPVSEEPEVSTDDTLNPEALVGVILDGPITPVCPPPAVDMTQPLHAGETCAAQGAAKAEEPCDVLLFEWTNLLGAAELVFFSYLVGPNPQITNQADCESSKISGSVTGEVNGHWQAISRIVEYGAWNGAGCSFPKFMQGTKLNIPGDHIVNSPYAKVRVGTRAIFNTPTGAKAATVRTQVKWVK